VVLSAGLALLFVAIGASAYWMALLRPAIDVAPGLPVQVEIPEGASTADIGEQLARIGVVKNANMFRLKATTSGLDATLRAGVYDLYTGMDYQEVLDTLAAGPPIEYVTVTIPEGFTAEQIAARFAEATGLSEDVLRSLMLERAAEFDRGFLAANATSSLEGYLFPKTYRVAEGLSERDIVEMMLDQFEIETEGIDLAHPARFGLTSHDWVTIASMIEREVRVADERGLVSSVIYNRLARGMRLEIDATIEYILPGTRPRLLNSHLEIDSPYNTYKYEGLPPGPIASPGRAALEAAADPADTGYLYYVLTAEDGSHTFTVTYEEFLEAKEKSREVVP
jgi:UPF0755 protein